VQYSHIEEELCINRQRYKGGGRGEKLQQNTESLKHGQRKEKNRNIEVKMKEI
jgi:hypothetical protein